jgi:Lamin Tail Domain
MLLLISPLAAVAEGQDEEEQLPVAAGVIITEVQTGAVNAGEEYIELYNAGDEAVDITDWQIRYRNASATTAGSTLLAAITGTNGQPVVLASQQYYVLHAVPLLLPETALAQQYAAGLSKSDKTVGLFAPDAATCQLAVQDAVAWAVQPATTQGEGAAVPVPSVTASKDKLLQRYSNEAGEYIDTGDNAFDFVLSTVFDGASPGQANALLVSTGQPAPDTAGPSGLEPVPMADCDVPDDPDDAPPPPTDPNSPPSTTLPDEPEGPPAPVIPHSNAGLKAPQLSELLPNPASPQTDAADEFIELYNPNDAPFDLTGYVLEAGLTTKRRYTLPNDTSLPAKSFRAFFSADTRLSLANTAGQVRLFDPLGALLAQSEAYASAKDGQAWLLANGAWQWTTRPTPNALNMVSAPAPVKKSNKSGGVQAGTTKQAVTTKNGAPAADNTQLAATAAPSSPLHPGVLALVGGAAVLYGAYEYRRDVANKFHQFRTNRAARRATRQGAEGR